MPNIYIALLSVTASFRNTKRFILSLYGRDAPPTFFKKSRQKPYNGV